MKKQYKYLLWDVDDTLIDFKSSEKIALSICFNQLGVTLTDENIEVYSEINSSYWELLVQGKIEKPVMLNRRFEDFAKYLSLNNIDYTALNQMYQVKLGDCSIMMNNAMEICNHFKNSKKQYALTNGTAIAQNKKLKNTGLKEIFDGVFISDEIGYEKPDKKFFNHVFNSIPNFNPTEAIMIGDSLSSDISGANNSGIDCCWFNHKNIKNLNPNIKIDYEIKELSQLLKIIE